MAHITIINLDCAKQFRSFINNDIRNIDDKFWNIKWRQRATMYSKMQLKIPVKSDSRNIFYRAEGFQQSAKKQEGVNFAHQTNKHQRIDFLQINQK